MKPEALARWKVTRAMGRMRYVLVSGVLSYGLPMFIVVTFFIHRDDLSPKFIGFSAIAWAVGGAVFGITMWYVLERQFRKATQGGGT